MSKWITYPTTNFFYFTEASSVTKKQHPGANRNIHTTQNICRDMYPLHNMALKVPQYFYSLFILRYTVVEANDHMHLNKFRQAINNSFTTLFLLVFLLPTNLKRLLLHLVSDSLFLASVFHMISTAGFFILFFCLWHSHFWDTLRFFVFCTISRVV